MVRTECPFMLPHSAEGVALPGVKPFAILPELFLPQPALLITYNLAAPLVEKICPGYPLRKATRILG